MEARGRNLQPDIIRPGVWNRRSSTKRRFFVTPEELEQELERPISDTEREEVLSLVRWFTNRYPSPEARLAYVRRAYGRWAPAIGREERKLESRSGQSANNG